MRSVPLLLLFLSIGAACNSGPWEKQSRDEELSHGALFTLTYSAPKESGSIAVAVVEADSTVRYDGFSVRDNFPPQTIFDIGIRWTHGGGSPDSLVFHYDGAADEVIHDAARYDVSSSPLFVAVVGPDERMLYRLPDDAERLRLPAETERELRERYPEAIRQE